MNKSFETTGGPDLRGNSPIAYAARWFGATEADIYGDGVEGKDYWEAQLNRLETIAMVDPEILLEVARMQRVEEEIPVEERFLRMGNLIQLSLMTLKLNERATMIADTLSSETFPIV